MGSPDDNGDYMLVSFCGIHPGYTPSVPLPNYSFKCYPHPSGGFVGHGRGFTVYFNPGGGFTECSAAWGTYSPFYFFEGKPNVFAGQNQELPPYGSCWYGKFGAVWKRTSNVIPSVRSLTNLLSRTTGIFQAEVMGSDTVNNKVDLRLARKSDHSCCYFALPSGG
jgi:hypothetical protein